MAAAGTTMGAQVTRDHGGVPMGRSEGLSGVIRQDVDLAPG